MLQSYHADTPQYLQLGEGVLLRGVDLDGVLLAADPMEKLLEEMIREGVLMGATNQGCIFRCVPEMIDLTRGKRTPAAGEILHGRWNVTLEGTLLEITPGNAAMLMNTAGCTAVEGRTLLVPEPGPLPDTPDNLCWIGTTGSGMAAIELYCPVSVGGFTFQAGRRGMGEIPFRVMAQGFAPEAPQLPCRFLWLKGGGDQ